MGRAIIENIEIPVPPLAIQNEIVNILDKFTELEAELIQAMRHIPMTMEDWEKRLNGFLSLMDREVLANAGRISAELAKAHAESEWEKYRIVQDRLYTSDFDRFVQLEERAADKEKGGEQ